MSKKMSRYICFHSWKSLDVKPGLSRTLSIMATSPSLACGRRETSRVSAGNEQTAWVGWEQGHHRGLGNRAAIQLLWYCCSLFPWCHSSPCRTGHSSPCPTPSEMVPIPLSPLVQLLQKKKKKSPALFTTSCFNFQDQFYAAKGHLFALLDQHEKYRVCAWDADRWPLARQ